MLVRVASKKTSKKPTREEAVAISAALRDLLDQRDEFGRKKYSQHALGVMLGVSQEAARRALVPDGVGPKIFKSAPEALGMTLAQIMERYHDKPLKMPMNEATAVALGELLAEYPGNAKHLSMAAFAIYSFHEPEKLTTETAKALILAIAKDEYGFKG